MVRSVSFFLPQNTSGPGGKVLRCRLFLWILLKKAMVAGQELPEPGEERADLKGTRTAAQKAAAGPVRGARPENPAGDAETVPVERYVSPIDFDALRAENPDIYAWLEIPDTGVQAPVCFRKGDNTFYLDHEPRRGERRAGREGHQAGRAFVGAVSSNREGGETARQIVPEQTPRNPARFKRAGFRG